MTNIFETVLQYRTHVMQMVSIPVGAGDGTTFVQHTKPMGWTWTEWKDVPNDQRHDIHSPEGKP